VSLHPSNAFNPRPRRLSTPSDAFQLHPDVRTYGTTLSAPIALRSHPVLTLSFAFVLASLASSMAWLARRDYRLTRGFGVWLVGLYLAFTASAVATELSGMSE